MSIKVDSHKELMIDLQVQIHTSIICIYNHSAVRICAVWYQIESQIASMLTLISNPCPLVATAFPG